MGLEIDGVSGIIKNTTSDGDITIKGNDGGSEISALTFDISAAGAATFNNKIVATELDISGDADIDGTTNLDIVDIDGAVNMATTALVTGVLTTTAATVFNGGFASNAASTITTADNSATLTLVSTDNDTAEGPILAFDRSVADVAAGDLIGTIKFLGEDDAGNAALYHEIQASIEDGSNGGEDGRLTIYQSIAGATKNVLDFKSNEIIFNQDSVDLDFRVESNGNANMLFVDGGNNRIGVGTASPSRLIDVVTSANSPTMEIRSSVTPNGSKIGGGLLLSLNQANDSGSGANDTQAGDILGRIVYQGQGTDYTYNGAEISTIVTVGDGSDGRDNQATALVIKTIGVGGNTSAERMRIASDGDILLNAGNIDSSSNDLLIYSTASGHTGLRFAEGYTGPTNNAGSSADGANALGAAAYRWAAVYAVNGAIQTSDRNEKQDIEELTDAEKRVAVVAKGLLRKYKFKDAVEKKGDKARTHFGIIAQDLEDAFTAEGLDASKYGMFCSDTWWETQTEVAAVEAVEEVTDEEGNVTTEAVEAKDAYTRTDTFEILEEAPEGATERTRLGVRYSELLAFIITVI